MSEKSPISTDELIDCKSILKSIRGDKKHKLIFAHLNINAIRNKFDLLTEQVSGNIDLLMTSETKIDESFAVVNFLLPGFSVPYRSDHGSKDHTSVNCFYSNSFINVKTIYSLNSQNTVRVRQHGQKAQTIYKTFGSSKAWGGGGQ